MASVGALIFILLQQSVLIEKFLKRERYVMINPEHAVTIEPNRSQASTEKKLEFVLVNLVNAIFSRNPYASDSEIVKEFLFTSEMREVLRDYYQATADQYKKNQLHEKAETFDIKAINISEKEMIVSCKGQLIQCSSSRKRQFINAYEYKARFSVSKITNISEAQLYPYKCHKFYIEVLKEDKPVFSLGVPYENTGK